MNERQTVRDGQGNERSANSRGVLPRPGVRTGARALTGTLAVAALALPAGPVQAARGGQGAPRRAAVPAPVRVYVGQRLVASGLSLGRAIALVRAQVPFAVLAPRYVPVHYAAVQLAVTPRLRAVSSGFTTLSYAVPSYDGRNGIGAAGFTIDQSATPFTYVAGTGTVSVTVGGDQGIVREFRVPGRPRHDILILSWSDRGTGYDVTTDRAVSGLSAPTLLHIARTLYSFAR